MNRQLKRKDISMKFATSLQEIPMNRRLLHRDIRLFVSLNPISFLTPFPTPFLPGSPGRIPRLPLIAETIDIMNDHGVLLKHKADQTDLRQVHLLFWGDKQPLICSSRVKRDRPRSGVCVQFKLGFMMPA